MSVLNKTCASGWVGLGLLLAVASLAGCADKSASQAMAGPPPAMPVKVLVEQPTTVQDSSEYVATVKSRNSASIQPQVEGQITKIYVKSGDRVRAGDRLLEIDPLKQRATVNSQEASRRSKQANVEWAKVQLDRAKKLYGAGVVSKQDLDQARTAYDAAQADLASLDAQVREQQVQLHYYEVVAPSDGIVGDIPVHVGDRVATSTLLTTVDRNVGLEAYINVPLERAPEVRVRLPVQILDSNGNVAVNCRVTFISPQVDTTTQSVLVKAAIPQAREVLRSAQFVRARLIWRSYPGLTVPVTAVARVSGQFFVFVAEASDKGTIARQRPIKVGDIIDNNYVVQDGLKTGDKVIVSGTQILADGSPVVVQG